MKNLFGCILVALVITACAKDIIQKNTVSTPKPMGNMPNPTAQQGARVYQQRCELCHGSKGMGEGALALTLKDYPSTNLLKPKYQTDINSVRQQIIYGGSQGQMHQLSPPWGDELTWTEIESTTLFIAILRENPKAAFELLSKEVKNMMPCRAKKQEHQHSTLKKKLPLFYQS